ncbi:guanylate kinase [Paenibacillus sp. P96]|uniref:Guanylate kinase n=1 Tax=Paenibacillus zeirhizosphaerae TaxID=2987519 RepID=A0ABT9FNJ5_9BACL|nr:guanylate kinase [Paenibacillus sp. P96]MDP4096306.1 guanylate kinase [Paenibacillus sp. P96]
MSFSLIVFQGPSASGKSTLQSLLGLPKVVTWTSRAPRPGEVNGRDYHFTTRAQLGEMFHSGLMIEMNEYKGNAYGTSVQSIRDIIEGGTPTSTVMEAKGAAAIKTMFPAQTLLVGVSVEKEQCRRRLQERGAAAEEIERRMADFEREMKELSQCDLIIRNSDDNLDKACSIIGILRQGLLHS